MATHAARRLGPMVDNVGGHRRDRTARGRSGHRLPPAGALLAHRWRRVHADIRREVAHYAADRYFAPDIEAAKQWVKSGRFSPLVERLLPSASLMR